MVQTARKNTNKIRLVPAKSTPVKKVSSFEELLLSGVKAIAAKGIDRITVSDVTKYSNHSRPTFYTYFGDMNGFLAEIWLKHGVSWLDSLVAEPIESLPRDELSLAILEIFAISHRNAEVAEVLVPDLSEWWMNQTQLDEVKQVRLAWCLSIKLGILMSLNVTPETAIAAAPMKYLAAMPDNILESEIMAGLTPIQGLRPITGIQSLPDDFEQRLLAAAIDVVGNSGYAAASMTRIARRSRVSTGTLYPRYKTTDAMIEASFNQAINQIVRGNVDQLETNLGADEYGTIVVAGFGEERKSWRNYRLEMYIESLRNPEVARLMAPGLEETRQILEGHLTTYGFDSRSIFAATHVMQNLAVGLSMLFNAKLPVEKLNHKIPPRYIQQMLANA